MNDDKYKQNFERANPGCIVFLIDQSFSMREGISGSERSKAEALSTAINRLLSDLLIACEKGEEKPRHYFDLAMVGYTTDQAGKPIVGSAFQGDLAGRGLVSSVELYDHPLDVESRQKDDGAGGLVQIKFPVWYKTPAPEKMAGTAMCGGLQHCFRIVSEWCPMHQRSFPPIVIHLTDGESTDGNPEEDAHKLQTLSTEDGNLLLFNCHLSNSKEDPILLPTDEQQLPNEYSRMLFRMSSVLPGELRNTAEIRGMLAGRGARCMVFNADSTAMIKLLSFGTKDRLASDQVTATEAPAPESAPILR